MLKGQTRTFVQCDPDDAVQPQPSATANGRLNLRRTIIVCRSNSATDLAFLKSVRRHARTNFRNAAPVEEPASLRSQLAFSRFVRSSRLIRNHSLSSSRSVTFHALSRCSIESHLFSKNFVTKLNTLWRSFSTNNGTLKRVGNEKTAVFQIDGVHSVKPPA